MIFLNSFHMLSKEEDESFFNPNSPLFKRKSLSTYHATEYPFVLFRNRNLTDFVFEDITIFYGNNGSGKSTILNVMAEALKIDRSTPYNRSDYFDDYVELCRYDLEKPLTDASRIITSDDVFERVLEIAKKHNTPQEEMPKAIVVISDMEIDYCGNREWSFYDKMANQFRKAGYVIPNIIFWNVNSRHDVFHADHNRKGVQLASGQSVTVFKQILQNLGYNPVEAMENTINSERYDCITVE